MLEPVSSSRHGGDSGDGEAVKNQAIIRSAMFCFINADMTYSGILCSEELFGHQPELRCSPNIFGSVQIFSKYFLMSAA